MWLGKPDRRSQAHGSACSLFIPKKGHAMHNNFFTLSDLFQQLGLHSDAQDAEWAIIADELTVQLSDR
jgi:hypothetical protein